MTKNLSFAALYLYIKIYCFVASIHLMPTHTYEHAHTSTLGWTNYCNVRAPLQHISSLVSRLNYIYNPFCNLPLQLRSRSTLSSIIEAISSGYVLVKLAFSQHNQPKVLESMPKANYPLFGSFPPFCCFPRTYISTLTHWKYIHFQHLY